MLKRFFVDKSPVLSGLSCFTAGSERSVFAADNERQDLKWLSGHWSKLEQTKAMKYARGLKEI